MGYSIRDERWRCTLWRELNGPKIVATELYDEKNDSAETVSVHDKSENKAVIEALAKHLPPVGSAARVEGAKKGKPSKSKDTSAKPATNTTSDERGPKFDKLDVKKEGKITREFYRTHQSDAKAAGERFNKFDVNNDGLLTREEFVTQGGKNPNAK